MSVMPPGGNGTMMCTGFAGQDWPNAPVQKKKRKLSRAFFKPSSNHLARHAKAHLAHIVAAQLAQRVAHELGGDLLAPV